MSQRRCSSFRFWIHKTKNTTMLASRSTSVSVGWKTHFVTRTSIDDRYIKHLLNNCYSGWLNFAVFILRYVTTLRSQPLVADEKVSKQQKWIFHIAQLHPLWGLRAQLYPQSHIQAPTSVCQIGLWNLRCCFPSLNSQRSNRGWCNFSITSHLHKPN